MAKRYTKEEKLKIIKEFNKCCSVKEREEIAKKYGYKNETTIGRAIYGFKKKLGLERKKIITNLAIQSLSDKKKLELLKKWGESSKEEKEKLAEKYNATYAQLNSCMIYFRKKFKIKPIRVYRTDEEKIKILEEYMLAENREEKIKIAEKYGMTLTNLRSAIQGYKLSFNIF